MISERPPNHACLRMFHGFDGNNEVTLMSIAQFVPETMDRFSRSKKRDFNSARSDGGTLSPHDQRLRAHPGHSANYPCLWRPRFNLLGTHSPKKTETPRIKRLQNHINGLRQPNIACCSPLTLTRIELQAP